MNLTIAHFYYDLLNLYGEGGNVKALKMQLENQGITVTIKFITIDDVPEFQKYDVIYIGAGTEDNQKMALKHLMTYRSEIVDAVLKNKFILATGNAVEFFGKMILDSNHKKQKSLAICNFTSKQEEFRIVDEVLANCQFLSKPIMGFQNQSSVIKDNKEPIFEILKGTGSYPHSTGEGIHYHNFYGTYLVGPILIRNPELLKYMVTEIIHQKYPDFKMLPFHLELEEKAYDSFMKHHYPEFIK